jgi:hypothetical protein
MPMVARMNKQRIKLTFSLLALTALHNSAMQAALAMPTASAVEALIRSSNDTKKK